MSTKPTLPWRRRQAQRMDATSSRHWWNSPWASRSLWTAIGGAVVFVLTQGVESLSNLRMLPGEAVETYHTLQSWYYDDAYWTGTWSSREEGDIQDYHQAPEPLKLSAETIRGAVSGEMFNSSVCILNPMLPPVLLEGEIRRGKLYGRAFAYVGGERRYLYTFRAERSEAEPVVTLTPIEDPNGLLPASARLVRRFNAATSGTSPQDATETEHSDLECAESPTEYLQRLRKEGVLEELSTPDSGASSAVGRRQSIDVPK